MYKVRIYPKENPDEFIEIQCEWFQGERCKDNNGIRWLVLYPEKSSKTPEAGFDLEYYYVFPVCDVDDVDAAIEKLKIVSRGK